MNAFDQARYFFWQIELWSRNYGSTAQIDNDVDAGKLIPGTMPDAYWRSGDKWSRQSEVEALIKRRKS